MQKVLYLMLIAFLAIGLSSCSKKPQDLEELQEPLSVESMDSLKTQTSVVVDNKSMPQTTPQANVSVGQQAAPAGIQATSLPPVGPYKPSNQEIQAALKNAGFYTGNIDGKLGPMSKKAIEAFQKANNLKADGKVGPKTWEVLSTYLNPPEQQVPQKKAR
ncbi:MAG: peptidoglycan-binding protein [Candidatus Omnitrophica bacterium]|jgi:peptidoglycan hydrolase-like protein with peptidoglycan-binding domain|nr:peptidoglycan-binding protein [Candidatus Omnitrophota bacterium]